MDFTAFDLRVGTIVEAVSEGDALRLAIDLGGVRREAVSRITENYGPDDLLGQQVVAVSVPGGAAGEVVVLAAVSPSEGAVVLRPDRPVANGTQVV